MAIAIVDVVSPPTWKLKKTADYTATSSARELGTSWRVGIL